VLIVLSQPRDAYTTTSNGSWVNALNWDVGVAPDNDQTVGTDDIVITHNITLTDDLSLKSGTTLLVEGCDTLTINGNVTFANNSMLEVEDCAVLIINGNVTNNNNSTDVDIDGTIVINGNFSGGNGSALIGDGAIEITGTITTDGTGTVFGSDTDCADAGTCDNTSGCNLDCATLPIELVFFSGVQEDAIVKLEWLSQSEINNDYYAILWSTDGINFDVVGTIKGAGNSSMPTMYSYIHNLPKPGINYYELIQYDFDGASESFKIISVKLERNDASFIIYPNPVLHDDQEINISLNGIIGDEILIVVVDILGKVYYEKAFITKVNSQIIILDSNLPRGTYMIVGSNRQELYKKTITIK
jgi:hypothetical protein